MSKGATEAFFYLFCKRRAFLPSSASFLPERLLLTTSATADRLSQLFGAAKESQEGNFMLRQVPPHQLLKSFLAAGDDLGEGQHQHPQAPPPFQISANRCRQGPLLDSAAEMKSFTCRWKDTVRFLQQLLSLLQITACSGRFGCDTQTAELRCGA